MQKDRLTIMVVTAHAGGRWTGTVFGLGDVGFKVYQKHADQLQENFDVDCDPVRVYVCRNGMPDYAALNHKDVRASWLPHHHRKRKYGGVKG